MDTNCRPIHPPNAYDRVMAQQTPACDACHEALEIHAYADGSTETENESIVTIGGGYGSFVDDLVNDGLYQLILCEACSAKVCRTLGLDRVLADHHSSTVCRCPDLVRPADNVWARCACEVCRRVAASDKPVS